MPLLEFAHKFVKFTQSWVNIFICDFGDVVQLCQYEFYQLYCDPYNRSSGLVFKGFNVLDDHFSDVLTLMWCIDLNGGSEYDYLAFYLRRKKYPSFIRETTQMGQRSQ